MRCTIVLESDDGDRTETDTWKSCDFTAPPGIRHSGACCCPSSKPHTAACRLTNLDRLCRILHQPDHWSPDVQGPAHALEPRGGTQPRTGARGPSESGTPRTLPAPASMDWRAARFVAMVKKNILHRPHIVPAPWNKILYRMC